MKLFFTLLLLGFVSIGASQTSYDYYDQYNRKADSLKNIENFSLATLYYEKALLEKENILGGTVYFKLAECKIRLGLFVDAVKIIRNGISIAGADMAYLESYEGFQEFRTNNLYKLLLKEYDILRRLYFASIDNIDIYLEVDKLIQRDQFVRKLNGFIIQRTEEDLANAKLKLKKAQKKNDKKEIKKIRDYIYFPSTGNDSLFLLLLNKVDYINMKRFMEITEEYGYQKHGWILLWHHRGFYETEHYVWDFFKPIIEKEIKLGNLSKSFWDPFDKSNMIFNSIQN